MARRTVHSLGKSGGQARLARACFEVLERRTYFGFGLVENGSTPPYSGECDGTTAHPIFYIDGRPMVNSVDLQSKAFGRAFGQTRSWVGVDNASANGNGWMDSDLPYLNIMRNDFGHDAILQVIRQAGSGPLEFTGKTSFKARGNHKNKLTYIAPYTDGIGHYFPGLFKMTDPNGNSWTFYDVPRGTTPISGTSYGRINADGGYPHKKTNQTTVGDVSTAKYQFGAFAGYTDSSGAYSVSAIYDPTTGDLSNVIRTDGSGLYERLHYIYKDISYVRPDNTTTATVVESVSLQRSNSSSGPWRTARTAQYDYYDPDDADAGDDQYGRLGDLKLVTISQPSSGTARTISTTTNPGSGKTATANFSSSHGYAEGDLITIQGASPAAFNGTFRVTGISGNSLTYETESALTGNATVSGTAYKHSTLDQKYYRYNKFYTNSSYADAVKQAKPHLIKSYNKDITGITYANPSGSIYIATATTFGDHQLLVGDWVLVSGADQGQYNGLVQVTATPTASTFKYALPSNPGSAATHVATDLEADIRYDYSGGTDRTFTRADEHNAVMSGLTTVVEGSALTRLIGADPSYQSATDLTDYANNVFTYQSYESDSVEDTDVPTTRYRAIEEVAAGAGCSACSGGFGTGKVEFTAGNLADPFDKANDGIASYNRWVMRAKEYLPDTTDGTWDDNDYRYVYTNERGQVMLKVEVDTNNTTSSTDDKFSPTYYHYTEDDTVTGTQGGDRDYIVHPSALKPFSTAWQSNSDLVNWNQTISNVLPDEGFVEHFAYGTTLSATNTSEGDVPKYLKSYGVEKGHTSTSTVTPVYELDYRYHSVSRALSTNQLTSSASSTIATVGWANHHVAAGDRIVVANASQTVYNGTFTVASTNLTDNTFTYVMNSPGGTAATGPVTVTDLDDSVAQVWHKTEIWDVDGNSTLDDVTTTYEYTFRVDGQTETNRVLSQTVSHPAVGSPRNGSNTPNNTVTVYDAQGRPVWVKDQAGYIHYNEYDINGAVARSIVDVDTTRDTDHDGDDDEQPGDTTFRNLPTVTGTVHWASPADGGLHLMTQRETDDFGRTTKLTDPKGNVTYTVYNDADHEWRRYAGWNGTYSATPIEIHREYRPTTGATQLYSEIITSSATPSVSSGLPTGTETITTANILSLSRSFTNDAGQTTETRRYFSLAGTTYSVTTPRFGTESNDSSTGNFYATYIDYDPNGKVNRTESSSGTITRTLYDAAGRLLSTWVGTDDTPVTSNTYWSASNTAGTDLLKVSENEYDYGGPGDGNLTKAVKYPGGGRAPQFTYMAYDWRDRLIWSKTGSQSNESDGVHRPITVYSYDNQGRVLLTKTFDGDGLATGPTTLHEPTLLNGDLESGPVVWAVDPGVAANAFGGIVDAGADTMVMSLEAHPTRTTYLVQRINDFGSGTYTVSFDSLYDPSASWLPEEDYSVATVQVMVDGQAIGSPITPDTVLSHHSVDFTVSGGPHSIGFSVGNASGDWVQSWLDNIELVFKGGLIDADADGVPDEPNATLLGSASSMAYDELGRVYKSEMFSVDPSDGSLDGSLVTKTWYDARGNTIKTSSPGGLVTKQRYDGAGRVITTYQTNGDGSGDSIYGNADDVVGDVVLDQTDRTYDANGNVTFTANRQRAHNATVTGDLADEIRPAQVVGRALFYNNSVLDGFNAGSDDSAIDTSVTALLPGGINPGAAISSYAAGINGIIIDVADMPATSLSSSDFTFKAGNDNSFGGWTTVSATPTITVRPGEGAGGSDRIVVTWADNDIQNTWLQVTLKANVNTGLASEDKFYFGSLIADTNKDGAVDSDDLTAMHSSFGDELQVDGGYTEGGHFGVYEGAAYSAGGTVTQSNVGGAGIIAESDTVEWYYGDLFIPPASNTTGLSSMGGGSGWSSWKFWLGDDGVAVYEIGAEGVLSRSGVNGPAEGDITGDGNIDSSDTNAYETSVANTVSLTLIDPDEVVPADRTIRSSYSESYYDAANRLTDSVNLGNNGGIDKTGPDITAPARSDTVLRTSYTYDSAGRLWKTLDPEGIESRTEYDMLGRTTKTVANYVNGSPSAGDDQTTEYTYNGNDDVLTMTARLPSSAFQTTQYIYGVDQTASTRTLTSLTRSGSVATATLSAHGYTQGQQITISGASQPEYNGTFIITDATANTFNFAIVGSPTTTATGTKLVSLSAIHDEDSLSAVRYPDKSTGSASGSEEETFRVNALGQRETYTDRNGSVHTYAYDVLGRMTADAVTTLGSGVNGAVRRIEYTYNEQGQPEKITSYNAASSGSVVNQLQREYNGLRQLTREYQSVSGAVNTGSTPYVEYAYSNTEGGTVNHSRLKSIKYPNGRIVRYEYGTSSNVVSDAVNDSIGRLTYIADDSSGSVGTHLEEYEYLGLNTVVSRVHPESVVNLNYIHESGEAFTDAGDQYISLDRFGRVVDQRWINGGTDVDRYQYTYDRNGNVLTKKNTVSTANSEAYSYDDLNRLGSFDRGTLTSGSIGSPSRSLDWNLDATGNWDSIGGGLSQDRTHNAQNQITGGVGTTPAYDNNGNLTTNESNYTLKYDAWNRLVEVKSGGTTLASYGYDGTSRRTNQGTTTLYYSENWQVLEERDSAGTARAQYVWSRGYGLLNQEYVDQLALRDRDTNNNGDLDERLYVMQDANYNTTGVVNTSGAVVERYVYDPYGAVTVLNGAADHDSSVTDWSADANNTSDVSWVYLPQGGRYDSALGLVDKRGRVYSVVLGRPIQADPMGYIDGASRYQWEASNPLRYSDPTGYSISDYWESVKSAAGTLANATDQWVTTAKMIFTNDEVRGSFVSHLDEDMHDGALSAINGLIGFELFGDDWMYDPCNPMLEYSEDLGAFASLTLQLASGINAAKLDMCLLNSCFLAGTPVLMGDGSENQAIDEIHVGQRVATDAGVANSSDGSTAFSDPNQTQVNPDTWRLVEVQSNDGDWQVQTLVPLSWLEQHHAKVGGGIYLSEVTDLAEMGVPADLAGSVLSISGCPQIEEGPGRVVLTTVNHSNNFVYTLTVTDAQGKADSIGITGYHRVYTEDRGWVIASELVNGEVVRTARGNAVVSGLIRESGIHRVYNMEVETDHVYYVGDFSALVHNSCSSDARLLRKALVGAGEAEGKWAAHIVPSNRKGARFDWMRTVLEKAGIGKNSAENGFFTNFANHNGTHTNAFYNALEEALEAAQGDSEAVRLVLKLAKDWALGWG